MKRWDAWHDRKPVVWSEFVAALRAMGRMLRARREHVAKPEAARHPLLDLVLGDAGIRNAIGAVTASEEEQRGVLSWASVAKCAGGFTIRLNHKGRLAPLQQAQDALLAALRRIGVRPGFRDLIRHPNQNAYVALVRVSNPSPALAYAR